MARPRNPLSNRNRNESFTGEQIRRFLEGNPVTLAKSKRARVVRQGSEFDLRALQSMMRAPLTNSLAYSWSLEQIVAARNAQMQGQFHLAAMLAKSFNTDDALFTARSVRLAPVQSLGVKVVAGTGPKSEQIRDEGDALFGEKGIAFSRATENTLRCHIVDHGVAFGAISWSPRADGSRWDPVLNAWPMEHVKWDALAGCYVTRIDPTSAPEMIMERQPDGSWARSTTSPMTTMGLEPIIHGNGRWVVFAKSELLPHCSADATLLPAALVWPCHAFANRDWRKGSASHGNVKVVGELDENTALTDKDGNPTAEATAFMALLADLASQDMPYGIRPAKSKTDLLANPSNMWQVFAELAKESAKAAARIYLGSDGILGAQGGAPGVDITALFGVHMVKIQSDMQCIGDGLQSGLINVWAAINWGDDKQAPGRAYIFPDPDKSEVQKNFSEQNAAFLAALKAAKDAGFALTTEYVGCLAEKYGVPVPPLVAAPTPGVLPPAPTPAASPGPAV
jgi:hypothetical protein